MKLARSVVWGLHGLYGAGRDLDEAFGLIETVEKAAQLFMMYNSTGLPHINYITDAQLWEIANHFKVTPKEGII